MERERERRSERERGEASDTRARGITRSRYSLEMAWCVEARRNHKKKYKIKTSLSSNKEIETLEEKVQIYI